jgi:hypothetical protein
MANLLNDAEDLGNNQQKRRPPHHRVIDEKK